MNRDEMKIAFKEVIEEQNFGQCCAARCNEKCGFSPAEHAKKHADAERLVVMVKDGEKMMKNTVVRTVTAFILVAFGVGVCVTVYNTVVSVYDKIKIVN